MRPARYDGLSRLCASLGRGRRCFPHTCAREGGNALDAINDIFGRLKDGAVNGRVVLGFEN